MNSIGINKREAVCEREREKDKETLIQYFEQ